MAGPGGPHGRSAARTARTRGAVAATSPRPVRVADPARARMSSLRTALVDSAMVST